MTPATEELLRAAIDLVETHKRAGTIRPEIPDNTPFERLEAAVERFRREEL